MSRPSPFAACAQTAVQDDLLEALLANKRRIYRNINPITSGGHGRDCEARHLLTYILRSALCINRLPGYSDLRLDPKHFRLYSEAVLLSAIQDARRVYAFGQHEMRKVANTISLTRGLRGLEASVARDLADKQGFPVRVPFQTFSFFNHVTSPFSGEATLTINAPIEWVWASEYTVSDLQISSTDEEILVAIDSLDGCVEVNQASLLFAQSLAPTPTSGGSAHYAECLGRLLCNDGPRFELEGNYLPGFFELRGRRLDRMTGNFGRTTLKAKPHLD